jgi:hypothetical protein
LACLETNSRLQFPLSEDLYNNRTTEGPRALKLYKGFEALATSFSLPLEIVTILSDQERLHIVIVDMDLLYTSDDIICVTTSLHYRLVLYTPIGAATAQSDIILSETCRLTLLIYLKPVLCCRMPYNDLPGKLKTCHDSIKASVDTNRREIAELLLWLMFLGGITALNNLNKSWFVAHLRQAQCW